MKQELLLDALGLLDDELIAATDARRQQKTKSRRRPAGTWGALSGWVSMAACLCLVVALSLLIRNGVLSFGFGGSAGTALGGSSAPGAAGGSTGSSGTGSWYGKGDVSTDNSGSNYGDSSREPAAAESEAPATEVPRDPEDSTQAPTAGPADEPGAGSPTLPGADKIYPTVMVDGQLYRWRQGRAILDELPDDFIYWGDLAHVEGDTPTEDGQFVSVFDVTGEIYHFPEKPNRLILRLTTDWLESAYVIFDLAD